MVVEEDIGFTTSESVGAKGGDSIVLREVKGGRRPSRPFLTFTRSRILPGEKTMVVEDGRRESRPSLEVDKGIPSTLRSCW